MASSLHISLFILSATSLASTYTIVPNPTSYIIRKDNHGPVSYAPVGHQGAYYQEQVLPQQLHYPLEDPYGYNSYGTEHGARPILQKIVVPVEEQYPKGEHGYYGNSEGYAYPSIAPALYGNGYGSDLGHGGVTGPYNSEVVYGAPHGGYLHSDGGDYSAVKHTSHGDKGSKGYKTHENYKKGEESDYGLEGHEDNYNKGVGKKGVHYDVADVYGSHNSASKGHKSGDFGLDKSHNKGEKTTGFHNVYHKNEYKKDREFYDVADDSGHYKTHGGAASHHGAAVGGYKKSGEGDSAYYQDTFGKNGFNQGGTHHDSNSGYSGKSGHDDFHNSHEDFANKAGSSHGNHRGYKGYIH